ncbi:SAM-dependent methyltransferase [Paenibacillus forsythiae]|uniref:SAM-dependent methyltransferase n=1 Tax=Paenibacillus forsythiae TaxID=365616 RepID=A0ABU3H617_9BACL|nr:methyltransferase domain-containing protein [Paenibacillus forsythiae]MDT3426266.1 SAM-dependent methyltransferase [Paenibacillus forsythiae]
MSKAWQATGMTWACPQCKQLLEKRESSFHCTSCGASYPVQGGSIPYLLPESSAQETLEEKARKAAVKEMFTSFNRALEDNGVSRFSTFINWGYAESGDENGGAGNLPRGVNHQSLRLLKEIMHGVEVQGKDVLEIACGRGGNIRALCKSYGPRSVAGLDLTEANIAFCLANNRYAQASYCVGDAEELPLPDASCDIVLNIESSDLYPRIIRFYDEVFRVLKAGGVFVYADDLDALKFEEGERYLLQLGFEVLLSRDISEQVLLASDLARGSRLAALGSTLGKEDAVWETMGVPGTSIYDDMRAGKRRYKILHLAKKA